MAHYAMHIFLIPVAFAFVYILIVAIKKQSETDRFFSNYDTLDKETIIRKLEYLEQKKGINLSGLKERIRGIKPRYIEHFSGEIDEALGRIYFDFFNDNWIAFRKANWGLKLVFFLGILVGFYSMGYIIYINSDEEFSKWVVLIPLILFPVSLLLSFIYIMMLSIFLTLFRFFAPKRGAVVRSCVLFNRMIRAMAPGRSGTAESDVHHTMDFLN